MQALQRHPQWIIGWREWISMPDLGIPAIKAKVDTGAASSALHATEIQRFKQQGVDWVSFTVHPHQSHNHEVIEVEAEVLGERSVRSSSGQVEVRPVVLVTLEILKRSWETEFTLTCRNEMGFRVLLGRRALKGRFLVDSEKSFVAGKPPTQ